MTSARVVRTLNMAQTAEDTETVERATDLTVSDGHLVVHGRTADGVPAHVAIFRPGNWQWAELVSDVKP